jgi:hypothetical protein
MQSLVAGLIAGGLFGSFAGYQVRKRYLRFLIRMEKSARKRIGY